MHRTRTRIGALVASTSLAAVGLVGLVAPGAHAATPPGTAAGSGASQDYAPRLSFPMAITTPAGTIHLEHAPHRIVSLSPTATEMLYAIGAGKQVVAVDDDSNYPPKGLPKVRFNAFSPNLEKLIALRPTLVVVAYNPNGLEASLAAAGIPVMEQDAPPNLKGTLRQLTWLGDATGHYVRSYGIATGILHEVQKDVREIPAHHRSGSVYFELSPPPSIYAAASNTYVGSLLKALGVTNIADPASNAENGGYPSLSEEYVLAANPHLIFLADTKCCHQSYATVAARPGFSHVYAVRHHFVIGLNDDIASRWGPRVSILMDELTAAVLRYDRT